MTSELAFRHAMIKIAVGRHPYSLTIKNGIRLSKVLAARKLSAEKRFCNCCRKILIGMPIDLL